MSPPRSILITGASSGIGASLAHAYAAPGIKLALSGRDANRLEAVAAACRAAGAECDLGIFDLRDTDALTAWIAARDAAAPIDLAIANAGLAATRASPAHGERPAEIVAQIQTNLQGTLLTAQTIGALMHARGRGQLALMSSLNGLFPVVEAPTYSATKAGILAYADAIRDWLEPAGVGVCTICPGFVRTAIAARYTGARPLEITADEAAAIIVRGLGHGRRSINFPLALVVAIHLGKLVPRRIRRFVLGRFSAELAPLDP